MTYPNDPHRAPKLVAGAPGKPVAPEPVECDYGPISDDFLQHIDESADQEELARGRVIKRFA
jgi:hypothetical protein